MRRVHDIRHTQMGKVKIRISFIQHGNAEDGYVYENVCPACAQTIEKVTVHPNAEDTVVMNRLLQGYVRHYQFCVHRGSDALNVEIATSPLGVEKVQKEQ